MADIKHPGSAIAEVLFIATQTDRETAATLTSSDTVFQVGDASFEQTPIIAQNDERTGSYATNPGAKVGSNMGTFTLKTYVRVPGSAGTIPPAAPLFESLMGRETVNAGVDVTYEHYRMSDQLKWLTILHQKDLGTTCYVGAVVNKGSFAISGKLLETSWSGFFGEKIETGMDELPSGIDGTSTPVVSIPLSYSAKSFDIGARIVVGTDDNEGAGFVITGKNEETKTLTIQGGVTTVQDAGAVVTGWAPVTVESGEVISDMIGDFKLDRNGSLTAFDILSATLEIDNGLGPSEILKGNTSPNSVKRGKRKVSLNFDRYVNVDGLDIRSFMERYESLPAEINVGDETGSIVSFPIPDFRISSQNVSGTEELKAAVSGQCHPSAVGDDEVKIIFK